jgi:hypothetical protein
MLAPHFCLCRRVSTSQISANSIYFVITCPKVTCQRAGAPPPTCVSSSGLPNMRRVTGRTRSSVYSSAAVFRVSDMSQIRRSKGQDRFRLPAVEVGRLRPLPRVPRPGILRPGSERKGLAQALTPSNLHGQKRTNRKFGSDELQRPRLDLSCHWLPGQQKYATNVNPPPGLGAKQ